MNATLTNSWKINIDRFVKLIDFYNLNAKKVLKYFKSVSISNNAVCFNCQAIISTGSTFIIGPSAIINLFHRSIGAVLVNGYYVIACNSIDNLPSSPFEFIAH